MPYADKARNAAAVKQWHQENKEKMRAYRKKYRSNNAEKIKTQRRGYLVRNRLKIAGQVKVLYRKNKAKDPLRHSAIVRKSNLKRMYGLSEKDYAALLTVQKGGCAICFSAPPVVGRVKHLHVDHDHKTGGVRGLLCSRCNTALGLFEEDENRMLRAIAYLKDNSSWL